jgi:hypothetical protein
MHDEKKLNIHTTKCSASMVVSWQNEVNGVSLFPISHLCAYTEKIASSVVALSGSCNTRIPAWEKAQ